MTFPGRLIIIKENQTAKPMTERSSRYSELSASPQRWEGDRERQVNGLRRADRTEAEAECSAGSFSVGTDGYPPVIHRDTYRWYVKSERTINVNLGGIAEAAAFVPVWDRGFFYFTGKCIL